MTTQAHPNEGDRTVRVDFPYTRNGTTVTFEGEDVETGETVRFVADWRPSEPIIEALHSGHGSPVALVESWQIASVTPAATTTTTTALRPVQALKIHEAKVSDFVDLITPWFEHLRTAGTFEPEVIPSDEEIATWSHGLFTDRGGVLRVRKAAAPKASREVQAIHSLYRWHSSGGNLHGLFAAKWAAGEAWDRVDTFIQVLLVASGKTSSALAAWDRTGLLTTTTNA